MRARKKAPPRPRSGWVSENDRNTEQLRIRCSPELAARARALLVPRDFTLADLLEVGVTRIEGLRFSEKEDTE